MSKIALVHDYFIQMGGAERVAEELHHLFPRAPLYTTVALKERFPPALKRADVRTSWMQALPAPERNFRQYFLLYPLAVEGLDLSAYDLVVSSSSGYAKGVRRGGRGVHVTYCHTPMRWVWRYDDYASREGFGPLKRGVLPFALAWLKRWELRAAGRPDYFIANSHVVAERIRECYGREAVVIPPPIDVDRFTPSAETDDYYLVLSRLVPYKRIDLAVEACTRLGRQLVVIGDGPDRRRLQQAAGKNVKFLGRLPDEVVNRYLSRCRALLFPGEEDFGMTPLEANAAGRPVIAYRAGGATETVLEGETGVFFNHAAGGSLAAAIEEFETYSWKRGKLRAHAERFDRRVFAARMLDFLSTVAPTSCRDEIARPTPPARPALDPLTVGAR
jgi:glycosyltransferase involved in cell wall biosynthesis